ncbi:uncharacterized protein LOC116766754 [Danaus plexippus]|uniref:uncharacterized protein LOC116766754 n=1 Tax=Danaus plexippus TaxID=13037 RepID=UPI002AB1D19E|nr:uncharacterized protein LOC116766754 [Danaus plexippus]
MAFPPFPSQDLAKLVLGYLAEEQLMTAYDEFLQASPYLDAFRNEYDRIFMTSLKNILAEYRAVKIYVETCKPLVLRRKLFQCTNLLEIVKLLVSYIDINRLHAQDTTFDKNSYKSSLNSKCSVCETCNFTIGVCVCKKSKSTAPSSQIDMTIDTSLETTSLADLPGNSISKKRQSKEMIDVMQPGYNNPNEASGLTQNHLISRVESQAVETPIMCNTKQNVPDKVDESSQKIEEFNTILNFVCGNNDSYQKPHLIPEATVINNKNVGNASSFQEFAKGVTCQSDPEKSIVPDSSTSENFSAQYTAPRENIVNITPITNIKGPPKQLLLTVGTPKTMQKRINVNQTKMDDQKITILSDIKVDNTFNNNVKMPPVLKSATSTPLLQFQTILINGTPAYKQNTNNTNLNYTKDEIMAMPTLFVVSATSASQNIPPAPLYNTNAQSTTVTTTTSSLSTANVLGPLVIDVPDDPLTDTNKLPDLSSDKTVPEVSLVTTVDITSNGHGSLPKNTNLTVNKSSTPNFLPPTRKSSSTPRRSSHVRVLDFTTPRRILHESINEQEVKKAEVSVVPDIPVHTKVISGSVNTVIPKTDSQKNISTKDKNMNEQKKRNWDAELRVLAVRNDEVFEPAPIPKPQKVKSKKKITAKDDKNKNKADISKDTVTSKPKKSKKKRKSADIVEPKPVTVDEKTPGSVIGNEVNETATNIACKIDNSKKDRSDPKINEDRVDTPENDRIALQNVIGARLNISDLLETPYKQVLYDIQMETPKFLGPDIPGEPISDIKIMSIPTPLFLNTPKPISTPYSTRPTDYSSGGSYYKPDDQDYIPPDILKCAVTTHESKQNEDETVENDKRDKAEKPSRPRRKCTKYVSYYKSPLNTKSGEKEKDDVASESSGVSSYSSLDKKPLKTLESKKKKTKTENKKKTNVSAQKSPAKKHTPKTFMKIKPRRTTPIKDVYNKSKRKTDTPPGSALKPRNRTSSKTKSINLAPIILAAPTKSRRKSSTPRKIQCTKSYNTNYDFNTSDKSKAGEDRKCIASSNDSDVEQLSLRWSDDGSQDAKERPQEPKTPPSAGDEEDITKIKEYIEKTAKPECTGINSEASLHIDLIKRGFDVETAKSIERDLLDTNPTRERKSLDEKTIVQSNADTIEANCSEDSQNEADVDEVEFTVSECDENSKNFITCTFDGTKFIPKEISKLKDKYSMELCIDDGVTIRLRATNFIDLFEDRIEATDYNYKETEAAVHSISDIDKLYTPMKHRGLTCHDIFDSTLTSLDTPIKTDDVRDTFETVTEIVLEVEHAEVKDTKKRKRSQGGALEDSTNKKTKPETQYLLNSANIQNIDIESVLSKLHGP